MYNIILVFTSGDSNISYSSLENMVELYFPVSWKLNVAMFWPNISRGGENHFQVEFEGQHEVFPVLFPSVLTPAAFGEQWFSNLPVPPQGTLAMPEDALWLA